MKIALIVMPSWSIITPPLGIATLATTLKNAGHEVKCFDFNVTIWKKIVTPEFDPWNYGANAMWRDPERYNKEIFPLIENDLKESMQQVVDWAPDVVGFTLYLTSVFPTRYGAKFVRDHLPKAKVIYGGPESYQTSFVWSGEYDIGSFDVAVVGEGEATLLEVLKRFENNESMKGCLGVTYKNENNEIVTEPIRPNINLGTLQPPDFSDFNFDLYERKAIPVMMSRGCVAKCSFCAETRYWKKFRFSPATAVFNEMKTQAEKYGIYTFEMADSLINGEFKTLSDLADLIIASGLKLKWGGYARIDKRMTYNLLGRLAKSGIFYLNFGLESGSQKVMNLMEKRTTVEDAYEVITNAKTFGIFNSLNIIVGYPGETEEDFQETIRLLRDLKEHIGIVSTGDTLGIIPGTPLYENPTKFGIKARADGTADIDTGTWISEDGTNTNEVRRDRLARLRDFLEEEKFYWLPSGNNKPQTWAPNPDYDKLLANEELYKYKVADRFLEAKAGS